MNAPTISHRVWRYALTLLLLIGLSLPYPGEVSALTSVTNPALPTTFAWPNWWHKTSGSWVNCDATWYNANKTGGPTADTTPMTTWRGIQACDPMPGTSGGYATPDFPGTTNTKNMFQCTELVARYIEVAYGLHSVAGDGVDLAAAYETAYPDDFDQYNNDGTTVYPQEGDVLSMAVSGTTAGHVAIVTGLSIDEGNPGDGEITLMDQNGSVGGTFTLTIDNYVIQNSSPYSNYVWVHPIQNKENSPTNTTTTIINSVVATSTSTAWIVGYDKPTTWFQPVAFNYDGTTWSKTSLPSQGSSYNHNVSDIAVDENADVWAVGNYQASSMVTLAYKRDHTTGTWSKVNSQTPASSTASYFNGVTSDGAGSVYAVGGYYQSGTKALIEKWNGTTFAQQTITFPGGVAQSPILDVDCSSSTNCWAVGGSAGGTAYRYDGTSWTASTLTTGTFRPGWVTVISSDEAWAIGDLSDLTPVIMKFTTASGWQQYTSTELQLPTSAQLRSIDNDGQENVWIAGRWTSGSVVQPFMMRYDGNLWSIVSTPSNSVSTTLLGVDVIDGKVWSAGYKANNASWGVPNSPYVLLK